MAVSSGSPIQLNSFLRKSLLTLNKNYFATFTFEDSDWKLLAKQQPNKRSKLDEAFFSLWIDYIKENRAWLEELTKFSETVDACGITDDSETLIDAIKGLSIESSQSLYAIKAVASVSVNTPAYANTYFTKNLRSPWLREVFADGLMAASVTTISNGRFHDSAEFMLSNLKWRPERQAIRYMLRPELSNESRSLHSFVAMLSHPFDAFQLLIVEIERLWARGELLSEVDRQNLALITNVGGKLGARLENMLSIMDGSGPSDEFRRDDLSTFFRSATSSRQICSDLSNYKDGGLAEAIIHCAKEIIPRPEMWERLYIFSIHWNFSDIGRLVRAFLHTLYLTDRESPSEEFVLNLSVLEIRGKVDEVVACAPSGIEFLYRVLPRNKAEAALAHASSNILQPGEYQNRFQMAAIHWRLQVFERDVRPVEWMSYVLRWIPIRPEYLSGLNWVWLDKINGSYRLGHFSKCENDRLAYIYCFLIALSEDQNRDPVAIRTMIKKLTLRSPEALLSYILEKTGDDFAAALVRYYLSTGEILHLKYAENPAAANLQRISSLDHIKRHCQEQKIIGPDYYETETSALQKMLFSQEINRGQFEFPWHRIQADARSDYKDYFETALELVRSGEGKKILGESMSSLDHTFKNKQAASYKVKNYQRQIATVILSLVDELLKQPVFGLEAILSSRFRHDTLERVFRSSATELITTEAIRLPVSVRREMHGHSWPVVSQSLNSWIATKLHSKRKSTPEGMFNLVPSQTDLDGMLYELIALDEFDSAFAVVQRWMVERLKLQLKEVRSSFEEELRDTLELRIQQAVDDIPANARYNEQDTKDYRRALTAAMDHCIADTISWFAIPEQEARGDFALPEAIEVAKQICDVNTNPFFGEFADIGRLPADIRKSALYTFVDAFANVRKHAPNKSVRISRFGDRVVFSNLSSREHINIIWDRTVNADNHDALFSEGDSGLVKIAAGMYALQGKPLSIRAVKRRHCFHLVLPLEGLVQP